MEREALAVHSRGHQREQERRRPDQRDDGDAQPVRGRDDAGARIGDAGTTCIRDEPEVVSGAGGGEQRFAALRRRVGADLLDRDLLQRQRRRERLQELPRGLRVLDDEMREVARHRDGARGQHVLGRDDAEQIGHEKEPAGHRFDRAHAAQRGGGTGMPAMRSSAQSRISGSPISAVGSSLAILSNSAMPSPSDFTEPAQS